MIAADEVVEQVEVVEVTTKERVGEEDEEAGEEVAEARVRLLATTRLLPFVLSLTESIGGRF